MAATPAAPGRRSPSPRPPRRSTRGSPRSTRRSTSSRCCRWLATSSWGGSRGPGSARSTHAGGGGVGLIDARAMEGEAAELCDRLGIHVDVSEDLGRLGLGTQQMIALARAVSVDSPVVIMDEPTSSLEAREVATLFDVARGLRDSGVALVFVSHRLDELWELCDSATVLRGGMRVHTGPMADLSWLELVSLMLGRSVEGAQRSGATEF